jgi:MOSC domain-containing protein YiiM
MTGRIFQINTSRGGVPKRSVESAIVEADGITIDRQNDLRHHGGPERAVCLFALERILALQEEGHPIYPGSTGENITTVGVDPARLVPGTRLRLGRNATVEILSYVTPCRNIAASFIDSDFMRISEKAHAGWSRVYAAVLEPGEIRPGDGIVLLEPT